MAILTLTEAKLLLQISDSSKDSLLTALIPPMQDFICFYCNNNFEVKRSNSFYNIETKCYSNKDYFLESYNIAFVSGVSSKIMNVDSRFVEAGFIVGMHVKVSNSLLNDGIYKIKSIVANQIEVEEQLTNESSQDNYIMLTAVNFPKALKIPFANLLAYELNKQNKQGIGSESLGDYSISITNEYPKSLLSQLIPFKRIG